MNIDDVLTQVIKEIAELRGGEYTLPVFSEAQGFRATADGWSVGYRDKDKYIGMQIFQDLSEFLVVPYSFKEKDDLMVAHITDDAMTENQKRINLWDYMDMTDDGLQISATKLKADLLNILADFRELPMVEVND